MILLQFIYQIEFRLLNSCYALNDFLILYIYSKTFLTKPKLHLKNTKNYFKIETGQVKEYDKNIYLIIISFFNFILSMLV